MTFPGGKYRGWLIEEVPSSYLVFSLENDYWKPYQRAIRAELTFRLGFHSAASAPPTHPQVPRELHETAQAMIEVGFRALAMKCHPDQGGDGTSMRRLIEARMALRGVLER